MRKNLFKTLILVMVISTTMLNVSAAKKSTVSADYEKGLALLRAGSAQEALTYFETCVKNYDNIADAYKNIALIKHSQGNLIEAIIALDKSLLEKPDVETYVLQASYYEEYRSFRPAIRVLNKAIDMEPTNPELYEIRARLKKLMGERDSALVDMHIVEELRAGRTEVVTNNSQKLRSYTVNTPISNKNLKSSDRIEFSQK